MPHRAAAWRDDGVLRVDGMQAYYLICATRDDSPDTACAPFYLSENVWLAFQTSAPCPPHQCPRGSPGSCRRYLYPLVDRSPLLLLMVEIGSGGIGRREKPAGPPPTMTNLRSASRILHC